MKSVCYPESHQSSSAACVYGLENEATARKVYMERIGKKHGSFTISKAGLVIDPFMGATPNGFIKCSCCVALVF